SSVRPSVIAVGGASGFIGRYLVRSLRSAGHRVVTVDRSRGAGDAARQQDALTWPEVERCGLPDGVELVCNLSGRSILDAGPALRLSTVAYRRYVSELFDSRIGRIRCLAAAAAAVRPKPPSRLVGVSAVGYYPSSSMRADPPPVFDESYAGAPDASLAGRLCASIEAGRVRGAAKSTEAAAAATGDTRRIAVRMGVALGARRWRPGQYGLAVPSGHRRSDRQRDPVAWVHISSDAVGVLEHALLADLPPPTPSFNSDVLNAVAPALNTNAELAAALAASLRRPALLTTPAAVVRLMFGAERAGVLTDGAFVSPRRTLETGYQFRFVDLREAMRDLTSVYLHSTSVLTNSIHFSIKMTGGGLYEAEGAAQAVLIGLTAVLACLLATLAQQLMRRRQLTARWAAEAAAYSARANVLKRAEQAKILQSLSEEELQLERDAVMDQLRQICGILAERQGGEAGGELPPEASLMKCAARCDSILSLLLSDWFGMESRLSLIG
uniref:Epimerase domain-containing protein n=1 Tax=Macrostomum lignano TaxID=282301 RepID=A0A1I8I2W4_9PLAT